mmetsp:Transcript_88551/g.247668  ORF Transcript_88551/g.247668 Transcript_88551/m.247668 type:complete len:244 (+) Transcript_88551:1959-2690(+)
MPPVRTRGSQRRGLGGSASVWASGGAASSSRAPAAPACCNSWRRRADASSASGTAPAPEARTALRRRSASTTSMPPGRHSRGNSTSAPATSGTCEGGASRSLASGSSSKAESRWLPRRPPAILGRALGRALRRRRRTRSWTRPRRRGGRMSTRRSTLGGAWSTPGPRHGSTARCTTPPTTAAWMSPSGCSTATGPTPHSSRGAARPPPRWPRSAATRWSRSCWTPGPQPSPQDEHKARTEPRR